MGKAIVLFKKVIEVNPYFAQAYYHLAMEYCDKAVDLGYNSDLDFLETLKPYHKYR
ncbi:MAG: hypothetical protein KKE64_02520 [Candidatus Omnitrophica bacterium]|nr:hypothetical protein [Candidatus Omnitrophota bacterium]